MVRLVGVCTGHKWPAQQPNSKQTSPRFANEKACLQKIRNFCITQTLFTQATLLDKVIQRRLRWFGDVDTARIGCRSFTPKRHRQLRVKDLPKVPVRSGKSGIRSCDPSDERLDR